MKIKLKLRPKTTIYLLLILFLGLQQVVAQDYCFPTHSPQGNSWRISEFSIPEVSYSISINNWGQTDNTDELIMISSGEDYTFQITTTGWVGVGAAIDFNNDGDFEDADEIVAVPTYIANNPAQYSYTVTIPASIPDDSYRLRLWNALANAGGGNPAGSPCGAYNYGTYADFTLVVGDCFPPVNIAVGELDLYEATVTWEDNGIAELWNVEYGLSGFTQGEGNMVTAIDEMTYTMEGLSSNMAYDVYVQSDCEADGESGWMGPVSFMTNFNTTPIEIIGLNHDVIANGVSEMIESTTNGVDGVNFCFLSEDWKLNESDPDITVGLPEDGIITSADISGLTYQMSPFSTPYEGNNSLRIADMGLPQSIEFATPESYLSLYFLTTSGSGSSSVEIVIHFDDESAQVFMSNSIPDWYQTGLPVEISGFGRGDRSNNNVETPSGNPKMFRIAVDIDEINHNKLITSVDVTKISGSGIVNIFAVSGKLPEQCESPTDFAIEDITQTSVEVSWSAPDNIANIDSYGWIVMLTGEVPFEDDPVDEGLVDIAETSVVVNDLDPDTTYDIYLLSVCDLDSMFFSDLVIETFSTDPLGINESAFAGFTFYPNPTESNLSLEAQEPLQNVQIFSLSGQEVFSKQTSSSSMNIDLKNLAVGVYILKVTISEQVQTFKVLKK